MVAVKVCCCLLLKNGVVDKRLLIEGVDGHLLLKVIDIRLLL